MAKPKIKIKNEEFRRELSGAVYQIKILLLLLWQGLNNKCKFRLRTEVEDAEKFDDALFYHLKPNGKYGIKFLQMKHARFDEARLVYKDFVDDYESSRCNLRKYFISFRKILQQFKEEDLDDFILCTNIPFSSLTLKKKEADGDDKALIFEEQTNESEKETLFSTLKYGEWKQYKLTQINDEVREIFKDSTNLSLLAEEIVNCITESENEGKNEVILDIRNYWLSLYHSALFNDNIIEEQEIVKLGWKFIHDFKKPSSFQTNFMEHLKLKTSMTKKEIELLKLDKKFKEICSAERKKLKQSVDETDLKQSAAAIIIHFFAEGANLDVDPVLKEATTLLKSEYDLDKNVEIFCAMLQEKLPDILSQVNHLRERENKLLPMLMVDHILGVENTEIVEAYLLNPVLFNQFRDVIRSEKEHAFTDDFISGNSLNENTKKFRKHLLENYQNRLAENLVHDELMASPDFKKLLKRKKDTTKTTENFKILARELASNVVNKRILTKNAIFEKHAFVLKHVFEERGSENIVFSGSFLNISQKQLKDKNLNEILKKFRHYLLKSLAIQKFKIKTFSLSEGFGKRNIILLTKKNVAKFAEEIIEIVQKTKQLDTILLYDKTKYGKDDTSGVIEALQSVIFEERTNQEGIIKFQQLFFDKDENDLSSEVVQLKQILIEKLEENEFNNLRTCNIKITNVIPFYETLEEVGIVEEEIEAFRHKLIIVRTPNETALTEVVKKEVSEKFSLIDSDIAADYLLKRILNWAKEKEERFLDEHEARTFLNDIQQKTIKSMICGLNSAYCAKLRSYGIAFKERVKIDFNAVKCQILNLITDETLLTAIKMEQTLSLHYKNESKHNIISTDSILAINNEVLESIKSTINLLVIVDNTTPNETNLILQFWKKLCSLIKNNPTKKVVVVMKKCSPSFSNNMFQQTFPDENLNFVDLSEESQKHLERMSIIFQGKAVDSYEIFNDMKELINSQALIEYVKNGELKIGKPLALFNDKDKKCYVSRKIMFMKIEKSFVSNGSDKNHIFLIEGVAGTTKENCYELGPQLGYTNCHFISGKENPARRTDEPICFSEFVEPDHNLIGIWILINSSIDMKSFITTTYAGSEINEDDLKRNEDTLKRSWEKKMPGIDGQYGIYAEVLIVENFYSYLCEMYPNKSVHWLKLHNNELYTYRSFIPPFLFKDTKALIQSKGSVVLVDEETFLKQILHDRIFVISDKAGMGKSTIVTSLLQNLENINQRILKWKIRINLNLYTHVLSEINKGKKCFETTPQLNFGTCQDYEEIIIRSLTLTDKRKPASFENLIFKYCFENGKMLIVFDGFDEISPDYEKYIMQLFITLRSQTQNKIWITSRTNFEERLKNKLNAVTHTLQPFNEDDQKEYLMKFWNTEWEQKTGMQIPDQTRLENYANVLLEYFYETIGTKHSTEIGIPLQTKMIAEIFQENYDCNASDKVLKWQGCFNFVKNTDLEIPMLSDRVKNLFMLYEAFVQQKI